MSYIVLDTDIGKDMYWMYLLWICNFYINFIADLLSFLLASRRSASMDWTAISFPPPVNRSIRQIVSIAFDRFFSLSNLSFLFFLAIVSPVRRMFVFVSRRLYFTHSKGEDIYDRTSSPGERS